MRKITILAKSCKTPGEDRGEGPSKRVYLPRILPAMSVRVAFLGAGGISRVHAERLTRAGAEIVAVCARSVESAAKLAESATPYAEFRKMLDEQRPEALVVAIPPGVHGGEVELAASRGIHVLLEKPIALDLGRARSMVEAVEGAGVRSLVGFHMRFTPAVARLRAFIGSGEAGRPVLFRAAYLSNALHAAWWRDSKMGGGQTVEQAIHLYDLALHLFGPAKTAWGQLDTLVHGGIEGYDVEDVAASMVRFENGALASFASCNAAAPTKWQAGYTAVFQRLTADSPDGATARLTWSEGKPSEAFWATGEKPREEEVLASDPYLAQAEHFLRVVRGEETSIAPVRDGLRSLELVTAVSRSASLGGIPVPIDEL
jgi:predicted dehydrogenase